MRIAMGTATLVFLVAVPGLRAQQAGERIAMCRATLNGQQLTTIIEFSNGYHVVGPWRILGTRDRRSNGDAGIAMDAKLDRVIERSPDTGKDVTTPFPRPIETRFEGATEDDLVTRAAEVWCATVLKVQGSQHNGRPGPAPAAPAPPAESRDQRPRIVLAG